MGHCNSKKHKKEKQTKEAPTTAVNNPPTTATTITNTGIVNTTDDHFKQANKVVLEVDPVKALNNIDQKVIPEEPEIHYKTRETHRSSRKTMKEELDEFKRNTPFLPHNYNKLSKDDVDFYKLLIKTKRVNVTTVSKINGLQDLFDYLAADVVVEDELKNDPEFRKLIITWKLFKWIRDNISYNGFYNSENPDMSVYDQNLFSQKSATAQDLASLVSNVLTSNNIECLMITGYLRKENREVGSPNHQWNAVKLYGKFRLIDCSSACVNSPYLDSHMTKIQYPDFFFCTIPHHLIYTHYPEVLEHSFVHHGGELLLDKLHYEKLPVFKCNKFIYGFQLMDHKTAVIDCKNIFESDNNNLNELSLKFCTLDNLLVNLGLNYGDIEDENTCNLFSVQKRKYNKDLDSAKIGFYDYYFIYEDYITNTSNFEDVNTLFDHLIVYEISIRLPQRELYNLEVYTDKQKPLDDVNLDEFYFCFSYEINTDFSSFKEISDIESLKFPLTSDAFVDNFCSILSPRTYYLKPLLQNNRVIEFKLQIPNAMGAVICYDGQSQYYPMTKEEGDIWIYTHQPTISFQDLVIAASFRDNPNYSTIVAYKY